MPQGKLFPRRDRVAPAGATAARRRRQGGQSVVEFALVIPIFITMLLSFVEFAFTFNAVLATDFTTRDAALAGAEAGNNLGADCVILQTVESDMGAPGDPNQIQQVEIYRTDSGGSIGPSTIYTRTGSMDCRFPDGTIRPMPYEQGQNDYDALDRCNILAGCEDPDRPIDHIGVKVTYRYLWKTPIGQAISSWLDVFRSNSMRMEPVL
ncbi:MAG TPA: TadE family protein [Candidatus Limnocylindrales bacterium]